MHAKANTKPAKVLPFSPLSPAEQRVVEAFARRRTSPELDSQVDATLHELGVPEDVDLYRPLDVGAGLIVARHACGTSLPSWSGFNEDGEFEETRDTAPQAEKVRRLLSIVILEINWSSSAPGMNWPEQYRTTWVPGIDRWVVTASTDTEDMYGYTDVAIGQFRGSRQDVVEKSRPIILRHWRRQKRAFHQPPWSALADAGKVGSRAAMKWLKEVWPRDPDYYLDVI